MDILPGPYTSAPGAPGAAMPVAAVPSAVPAGTSLTRSEVAKQRRKSDKCAAFLAKGFAFRKIWKVYCSFVEDYERFMTFMRV